MEHQTPLASHFKQKHFWFDVSVLAALFLVAAYYPLLKIIPLVATLELLSFFSFHLLAKRSHIQVQAFVGGLVSSTVVYVQLLNDKKFSSSGANELTLTLLFALCAMLVECIFVIFFITGDLIFIFYLPFLAQLFFFLLVIAYFNWSSASQENLKQNSEETLKYEIMIDHPIVWKNVARFSIIVIVLIYSLRFIGTEFGFSRTLSTLFVSLFEAHATLASVLTEWSLQPVNSDLMELIFVILLGNTISKSFLVLRGKNMANKRFFIALLFAGLVFSTVITFIWNNLFY